MLQRSMVIDDLLVTGLHEVTKFYPHVMCITELSFLEVAMLLANVTDHKNNRNNKREWPGYHRCTPFAYRRPSRVPFALSIW